MRILITGNMGYVGPVLARELRRTRPGAVLVGFDSGYFAHCLTTRDGMPEVLYDEQHFGDLRAIPESLLKGVDAVVHLAGLSNDPMGNEFENVTEAINLKSSIDLAHMAKAAGVGYFVFASSCSVYGFATEGARKEGDSLNPLTAYARSKIGFEKTLSELAGPGFRATCLRFATACGFSERLRLDLVLNDFVAAALTTGTILILSDGTPWRPLIHVHDMSRAIDWGLDRKEGPDFLPVNTGSDVWNYQIKELAQAVARQIPGTKVEISPTGQPDKRSYRVDFSTFRELAPNHQPIISLEDAIRDLADGLRGIGFSDGEFRKSNLIRLNVLRDFKARDVLTPDLYWKRAVAANQGAK